jgi:hypothetical protein
MQDYQLVINKNITMLTQSTCQLNNTISHFFRVQGNPSTNCIKQKTS